ncbi:hypothetical protein HNR02_002093 [Amycolatopsis endophytica]|uniref:Uncharacterized protein n=1 Tax=Amycolatopsis endophytica TaxID=860233 RepID=A0A853B189_9PSEU|nr:DUF6308 family protein [Amycolatopsis endophytica]NYI88770.1 hypothetical protein [Amycolatopsis endophytica]
MLIEPAGDRRAILVVADRTITLDDAIAVLERYPEATPPRYDLPGPGDPYTLSPAEVVRTRVVRSRISTEEMSWFIERALDAPWVPPESDLRDADPAERSGLYADMTALYRHFMDARPRGVSHAKVSKVLHVKRPSLFPILDQHVFTAYRVPARLQAQRYPQWGYRSMTWAAVREDLLAATMSGALERLRTAITLHAQERVLRLAGVTDLRLLDMLTW